MKTTNFLTPILKKQQESIKSIMPAIIEDKAQFFNKTVMAIKRNPDLLKYTSTQAQAMKLIVEIEKLARLGLTIGGERPQAYIIPFGNTPTSIPTADGYKFIVTHGKNPLFKKIDLYKIFKDDKFTLDEANGIFEKVESSGNSFNNEKESDFVGFVFIGEMANGQRIVKKVTRDVIEHHKKFSKQKTGTFWNTHFMRMAEKTAMKHVLRDYIYVCEGLANLEYFEREEIKTNDDKISDIDVSQYEEAVEIIESKKVENTESEISDII